MNLERLADLEQKYGTKGLSVSDQIDVICDEFEQEWQSGRSPKIDDYVARVGPASQSRLFSELLAVDVEYRQKQSQQAHFEDLFKKPFGEPDRTADRSAAAAAAPDDAHAPPSGTMIGHYQRLEKIGAGGFGTVWRSLDTHLQRLVAVKISHHPLDGGVDPERFLREARIAARLTHPGIVSVFEVGCESERAFIVSEYIAGSNLDRWFVGGNRSATDAAVACLKIAMALEYAHQQGVVHRDLKPANILVDAEGEPHITDFGVAKCLTNETAQTLEGQLLGTPAYMSPEQAAGQAHQVDVRSDVYSLGVILYQLLAGQVPFVGPLTAVLHQVVNDEPPAPRIMNGAVPLDLESICLKAMAKATADRYASAQDLADDLRRFLGGEHTVARPRTVLERAWRRFRRNSVTTGGAAFLALMVPLASLLSWNSARWRDRSADVSLLPRAVRIITEPPGATVAIAPIDEETGRPFESKVIHLQGTTPLMAKLVPGNYLVVAKIPGYGFHEVHRLVPQAGDAIPFAERELQGRRQTDGIVDLAVINIRPESEVIAGLARFAGGRFLIGDNEPGGIPVHECDVPAFYLAPYEVTVADYLAVFEGLPTGFVQAELIYTQSSALTCITFAEALDFAEQIGLRLPTEQEYEFAATEGGTRTYPWGDDGSYIRDWKFDAVGEPQFDRTATNPPVFGLYSNVAEWTDSRRPPTPDGVPDGVIPPQLKQMFKQMSLDARVIRGGPYSAAQRFFDSHELRYGSRWGHSVPQNKPFRGVGFRCARSVKPRFLD